MILEGLLVVLAATALSKLLIVVMAGAAVYLWVLNRRIDALPANAERDEAWLKDEDLPVP